VLAHHKGIYIPFGFETARLPLVAGIFVGSKVYFVVGWYFVEYSDENWTVFIFGVSSTNPRVAKIDD